MEIEDILNFATDIKFNDNDMKIMKDIMDLRKHERILRVYRTRMRPEYVAKTVNIVLKKYNKLYKGKIKCENDEDYEDAIERMISHIEKKFNNEIMNKITNKILEDYKMNIIQSGRYGF
jgi:hypothetical protein